MSKPLIETNPYLMDPQQRGKLLYNSVCSSAAIEGVKVTFPLANDFRVYPAQVPLVKRTDESYGPRR